MDKDKKIEEINELYIEDYINLYHTLDEQEKIELINILKEFDKNYKLDKENYLTNTLREQLLDKTEDEILTIKDEIINISDIFEENRKSFEKHRSQGRSRETWIENKINEATKDISQEEKVILQKDIIECIDKNNDELYQGIEISILNNEKYLTNIDKTLKVANENMQNAIHTKNGNINLNPRLDGFIAEQHHANTFNANAVAKGSNYRAEVLEAGDSGFGKNSVDIVIKDTSTGKVVKRYQSKYCKDENATIKAFEKGDYRGQRKLVADGQQGVIKNSTNVIESPDGIKSEPLSKQAAEKLRDDAQNNKQENLNIDYKNISNRDLAIGITKQACTNGLYSGVSTAGMAALTQLLNDEELDAEKIVKDGVISGLDTTAKSALASSLKVGVEKGVIKCLPKATTTAGYLGIATVAIDGVKIMSEIGEGKLTLSEGMEKMQDSACSTVGGILCSGKGAGIGATIGTVLGPIGTAIGSFVGGFVGSCTGSKIGQAVSKGARTIVKGAKKIVEKGIEIVKSVGSAVVNTVKSIGSAIGSLFSSIFGF